MRLSVQKRAGFTLIELLIVVAIIGILAAIAVPNFLNAQIRAKVTRSLSDHKALLMAEQMYRLDENTYHIHSHTPWQHVPLTTPIAYLNVWPVDVFQEGQTKGAELFDPYAKRTVHWEPIMLMGGAVQQNFFRDFSGMAGWNSSAGPASVPIPYTDIVEATYDSTNGLISDGMIVTSVPGSPTADYKFLP